MKLGKIELHLEISNWKSCLIPTPYPNAGEGKGIIYEWMIKVGPLHIRKKSSFRRVECCANCVYAKTSPISPKMLKCKHYNLDVTTINICKFHRRDSSWKTT